MNIPRDKKFYECGDWIDILAEQSIQHQPKDVRLRFYREAREDGHRREYYSALEFMSHEGPDWEDLTEEVREGIRNANIEHAQAMQAFGESLAKEYTK